MASLFSLSHAALGSLFSSLISYRTTSLTWTTARLYSLGFWFSIWTVYNSYIYPFYVSPLRHIPTVPGSALIGHAHIRLANEFGVPEREWHNKYGLIVRYFLPFGAERLSIADVDAIREVNLRSCDNFVKPERVRNWMKGILGERGVLLVDGEEHARQRKALAPAFSTSSIRALEHHFWGKGLLLSDLLGQEIDKAATSSKSIEILSWLNRATLDVICSAAFDYHVDSLLHPEAILRKAYSAVFAFDLFSCVIQGLRLYFPLIVYLPVRMNQAMEDGDRIVTATANDIVQAKLDKTSGDTASKDIISLVVKHNESLANRNEDRLTFEDIRDQVKTFLGAGHDTTATGVAWTIDLLSKHTEVQDKLRKEVCAALPMLGHLTEHPTPETLASLNILDRLPYLAKVCQESLRFIPPIPATIRLNLTDTHLGGYFIPAGTNFYIASNTINHLPHYWGPTADKFDPERWDHLPENWCPTAMQTFLEGPRGCIGRRFAEVEMKAFLCCLVAKFTFERDEDWEDQEKCKMWRLVLRPRDGINVKMRRAESRPKQSETLSPRCRN